MRIRLSMPLRFIVLALLASAWAVPVRGADVQEMTIFDRVPVEWAPERPSIEPRDPYLLREKGHEVQRTLMLPPEPMDLRDARRIIAVVTVSPVLIDEGEQMRIADPWSRLGSIHVVVPGETEADEREIELMRFVTGFGGEGEFTADVTAYAPVLSERTTIRARILTWMEPAWELSMRLEYHEGDAGYRRPALAEPIFAKELVTAGANRRTTVVDIPAGVGLPRLVIHTTGHGGVQEFVSATHILRIDQQEIVRWRPWRDDGGTLHEHNPASEQFVIDGRVLWSADLDRAGWLPGARVDPLIVPVPELVPPGRHVIEIEIVGILKADVDSDDPLDGPFWVLSASVVADEPWPAPVEPAEESPQGGGGQ